MDAAARLPALAMRAAVRAYDQGVFGALTFVLARHRAIDDALVAGDHPQVVLLGAGYDSRTVRLEPRLRGRAVFEVDHPATAARKRALAPAAFGDAPRARVLPVTVDFARESLDERLLASGLDRTRPTFWVWEGVTMYLTPEAIDSTLSIVRALSPAGSRLAFDSWSPPGGGLRALTHRRIPALFFELAWGEPLLWGPPHADLAPFLAARGLRPTDVVAAHDLVRRYDPRRVARLVGSHATLAVADW